MNKNVLLVLVSLVIGLFVGYQVFYSKGYDDALSVCRTKLESVGLSQANTAIIKIASGKVMSIVGEKITLEIYPPTDLLKDSSAVVPFTRVADINDKTVILARSVDSSRIRNLKPGATPVSPFVEKPITLKDITLGTVVDFVALSDINANNEFVVSKIVINQ